MNLSDPRMLLFDLGVLADYIPFFAFQKSNIQVYQPGLPKSNNSDTGVFSWHNQFHARLKWKTNFGFNAQTLF